MKTAGRELGSIWTFEEQKQQKFGCFHNPYVGAKTVKESTRGSESGGTIHIWERKR